MDEEEKKKTPVQLMAEALDALPEFNCGTPAENGGWREVPYGRSPGMAVIPIAREYNEKIILAARRGLVYIPAVPARSQAAKNKRRARARWRAREKRRNAGASALVPAALPAPAPATAGEPGPVGLIRHIEMSAAEILEQFGHPVDLVPKDWRYAVRAAHVITDDEAAGLVPLPQKPRRVDPPYVPNKWGEHD